MAKTTKKPPKAYVLEADSGTFTVSTTAKQPVVYVTVTPEQKAAYDAAAGQLGKSLREWATNALDAAVSQQQNMVLVTHPTGLVTGIMEPINGDGTNRRLNALEIRDSQHSDAIAAYEKRIARLERALASAGMLPAPT